MKKYKSEYDHLARSIKALDQNLSGTMNGFYNMKSNHSLDTALPAKIKELIALGIAITTKCEGCMTMHVHDAIRMGASRKEIEEAIAVAIMMGGGSAIVYASQALEALEEFGENVTPARLYDHED